MSTPKVSVIIPVYNVEPYLRECLNCVVGQTLREIEIICVDDGSTDGSYEILREYENKDPRVIVLRQENAGAGAARNKGLTVAEGEYLSFLDADDFFEPSMLEKAYYAAAAVCADVVVYGSDRYYQQEDRFEPMRSVNKNIVPDKECFAATDIKKNIFRAVIGWTWDKLFKRSFIERFNLKFQQIRIHNDLLFTFAAWASAERITVVDDVLVHQRKRGGGSLSDEFKEWWCTFDALYALKQYLEEHSLDERFFPDFINYVVYLLLFNLKRLEGDSYNVYRNKVREEWLVKLGFLRAQDHMFYDMKSLKECRDILFDGDMSKLTGCGRERVAEKPKVTVLVPVLNAIQYIDECIVSIINQTLDDIEVLCIDAGSTDGTLERLEKYSCIDRRIRIIHSPRKSYGHQMNLGIENARGEYVGIVESDDRVVPHMYERLYGIAAKLDLDLIKADYYYMSGTGDREELGVVKILSEDMYGKVLSPQEEPRCVAFVTNTSGLFRRGYLAEKGIKHNETPGAAYQDNGFCFIAHCLAKSIYFLDEPLYCYRRDNPGSSIHDGSKIYTICEEYDYIYRFLTSTPELYTAFIKRYTRGMFYAYWSAYLRISEEYKLQFLKRFSADFKLLQERQELYPEVWSRENQKRVQRIMNDPEKFYFEDRAFNYAQDPKNKKLKARVKQQEKKLADVEASVTALKKERKRLKTDLSKLRGSVSFRIGRAVTFVPRKLRGGVRCLKEHGLRYTLHRIGEKSRAAVHRKKKRTKSAGKRHEPRLIVSLTSYPARIGSVHKTVETLLKQTERPDKIVLWLAREQFPRRKRELPDDLLALCKKGLEIRWCDDLKCHKKYFYAMQKYPDAIIITVDDDIYYDENIIATLYRGYKKYPGCVICTRGHTIKMQSKNAFDDYCLWHKERRIVNSPSYLILPTGVGGVLYPPHCLPKETFDEEKIRDSCLKADDLWLKWMELKAGVKCVQVKSKFKLDYVEGTQEEVLWRDNEEKGNNHALARITDNDNGMTLDGRKIMDLLYKEAQKREKLDGE